MKKIKHPTEILTEAEAIVISSSIIFALSIIIFCFKHFYFCAIFCFKGSSQHQVGGEWFEIELGKISRMLVKYEVLPISNVISVC